MVRYRRAAAAGGTSSSAARKLASLSFVLSNRQPCFETASYISHHLELAGRASPLFSDDALALIHDTSRGKPRTVNNLALAALVATYAAGKKLADESAARAAVAEVIATE